MERIREYLKREHYKLEELPFIDEFVNGQIDITMEMIQVAKNHTNFYNFRTEIAKLPHNLEDSYPTQQDHDYFAGRSFQYSSIIQDFLVEGLE